MFDIIIENAAVYDGLNLESLTSAFKLNA